MHKDNNHAAQAEAPVSFRPLLLAKPFVLGKHDPTGWLMSHKLDGIRAYWDGEGTLWSRQGNPFAKAPAEYLELLPEGVPLDGELYLGPGRFNDTVRAVKGNAGWGELRYCVFDAPSQKDGGGYCFEERTSFARDWWADTLPQVVCEGVEHLQLALKRAEAAGLEGIMLRQPGSLYEGKRSSTLLKVKSFRDLEVRVIDHIPGKGKHAGRLGALACVTPAGMLVDVGTGLSDAERENPPPIGATITIRYQELTPAGVPRFPVFVAVRDYE